LEEQKKRGIVFSSCLSTQKYECLNDTRHEIKNGDVDASVVEARLRNDRFFNNSHYKYNIIRSR